MNLLSFVLRTALVVQPPANTAAPKPVAPASPAAAETKTAPLPAPERPQIKRSGTYGMLFGGAAAAGVFIWGAGLLAASMLDSSSFSDREIGRVLAIPVVGPFIATNIARRGTAKDGAAYAMFGVTQTLAIGIMSVGAVGVHRHRIYDAQQGKRRELRAPTTVAMVAGGLTATGLIYGMTVGFSGEARRTNPRYGRRFYIPVFGGIAAAAQAPSNMAAAGALTSSAFQIAGVGLAAAGVAFAVRRRNHKSRVSVVPTFGPGQAQLTATLRF